MADVPCKRADGEDLNRSGEGCAPELVEEGAREEERKEGVQVHDVEEVLFSAHVDSDQIAST